MKDIREEMNISLQEISLVWLIHLKRLLRDLVHPQDMTPCTTTTIIEMSRNRVGLIHLLRLYTNIFQVVLQILFSFPFSRSNFHCMMNDRCSCSECPLCSCVLPYPNSPISETISPLLADWMAILPTMNVCWGIRLPRKEFSGQRASANPNCFDKCLTPEMNRTIEKPPIKMS